MIKEIQGQYDLFSLDNDNNVIFKESRSPLFIDGDANNYYVLLYEYLEPLFHFITGLKALKIKGVENSSFLLHTVKYSCEASLTPADYNSIGLDLNRIFLESHGKFIRGKILYNGSTDLCFNLVANCEHILLPKSFYYMYSATASGLKKSWRMTTRTRYHASARLPIFKLLLESHYKKDEISVDSL